MAILLSMMPASNRYRGFRDPAEVIQHAVWLSHCFSRNLQEVELVPGGAGRGRQL